MKRTDSNTNSQKPEFKWLMGHKNLKIDQKFLKRHAEIEGRLFTR